MTWLLAIRCVLLLAAALGHLVGTRAARATGLPEGKVLLQDTEDGFEPFEALISERHGLVGRPDYVVETAAGLVPVEIKSSPVPPRGPYDNHVAQLMGYCLLVEDSLQRPVSEGVLRYRDGEVRIPFTDERREWVLGIIDALRQAQQGESVHRSHGQVNKCRGCSVGSGCGESIGWAVS